MALEGVNASIPLQAGRNLPTFGPDYNAIADMQKTQIALQNAKQVQDAQNALKALYSDQNNYDAKTLQPTQNAMAQLMRTSPQMGMDLTNNLAAVAEKRLRSDALSSEVMQRYQGQARDIAAQAVGVYEDTYKTTGSQQAAQAAAQKVYSELVGNWKTGLPPDIASKVAPNFDPVRARATMTSAKTQEELQKNEKEKASDRAADFTTKTDPLKNVEYREYKDGHITDLAGNPFTPSGVGTAKPEKPMKVETVDGKTIDVRPTAAGGWVNAITNDPIDPKTLKPGSLKPETAKATDTDAMTPSGPQDLHGDDYLKALPGSRAALIKGYADGRIPIPSSFALGKPAWEKVLADLTQYDPSFDAINYQTRYRTRQDFTSGKSAQNITSFNTAIGHLGTLKDAADGLGNSWSPHYNTLANLVESAKGDPRVVKFNTAKQAVIEELERAFRGTGGSQKDIDEWGKNINSSNSPEQLQSAVSQAVKLLGSRIDAVGEQYQRGMGTTADVTELLSSAAKKTLSKLPNGEEILNEAGMRRQGTTGQTVEPTGNPAAPEKGAAPASTVKPNAQGVYDSGITQENWKKVVPSGQHFRLESDPPGSYRTAP